MSLLRSEPFLGRVAGLASAICETLFKEYRMYQIFRGA